MTDYEFLFLRKTQNMKFSLVLGIIMLYRGYTSKTRDPVY